ncbi:MAG TPA: DUF2325 domain-containing protein [Polyangiaceae bacterium]|nr:DUF2325 domain-containing protein [Polyangiaceae bacterium]
MHIGLVGGLDRNSGRYEELAREAGHSLECHTGHLAGTGQGGLESLIARSDLVIVITDVNSHGAVWRARELARVHERQLVLVRRIGTSRFRDLARSLGEARPSVGVAGASETVLPGGEAGSMRRKPHASSQVRVAVLGKANERSGGHKAARRQHLGR